MPSVAIWTTVPGNPASATSMFEPPDSTSSGLPAASVSAMAWVSWSSVDATIQACAGPPTRAVVWCARRFCTMRLQLYLCLGTSQHSRTVVTRIRDGQVHPNDPGFLIDSTDLGYDVEFGTRIRVIEGSSGIGGVGRFGHRDHAGESGLIVNDGTGVVGPFADEIDDETHGEHAVCDHTGQLCGLSGGLRPVDRVVVTGCSSVTDQIGASDIDGAGRDHVTFGQVFNDRHEIVPYPRISSVEVMVAIGARSALITAVCVVMSRLPARSLTAVTVAWAYSSSPATTARGCVTRWAECTTRAKSTAASGSWTISASARWAMDTKNVGGATRSLCPAARATSTS